MAKLRKAFVPYIVQPPSFVKPNWDLGLTEGLKYAASIPYEFGHSSNVVGTKATIVSGGSAPTYSVSGKLGKTVTFPDSTVRSLEFVDFITPTPPLTFLVNVRFNNVGSWEYIASCGGSGSSGGGWGLSKNASNQLVFTFGGVADYTFTTLTFTTGVDYTILFTVTGNGGTCTPYVINRHTNVISTETGQTVGTMLTAAKPLTLGGLFDTVYSASIGIVVGTFALWNRALSVTEVYPLLANPYQIWTMPAYGGFSGVTVSLTGVSSTTAVGTITSNQGTLLALTGVGSTTSLSSFQALQRSLPQTKVSSVAGVGALAYSEVSHGVQTDTSIGSLGVNISLALTGVEEISAVGTVLLLDPTQTLSGVESTTVINGVPPNLILGISGHSSTVSLGSLVYSLGTDILAAAEIRAGVGDFGVITTAFVDITGVSGTGSVGTVGVDYDPNRTFALTGNSVSGQVGTITQSGGVAFVGIPTGGLATKQKKHKKTAVERDYSLVWLITVLGSEEKYLGPKIKQYYPQISDNSMTHTINNIVTEMRHYFIANPDNLTQSEINMKENITVKFYALKALQMHNSKVKIDESPYKSGMLS
jgi:hypothetical protein